MAFNALPGEPGNNPTINAKVGDRIIFNVVNAGKSFHAFGVTLDDEGLGGILGGTAVAAANSPLKPGEGGASEFIPGEPGTLLLHLYCPRSQSNGYGWNNHSRVA